MLINFITKVSSPCTKTFNWRKNSKIYRIRKKVMQLETCFLRPRSYSETSFKTIYFEWIMALLNYSYDFEIKRMNRYNLNLCVWQISIRYYLREPIKIGFIKMPCPQPCLFKVKTQSQKSPFWKFTIINMRPKLKRNRKFKKSQKRFKLKNFRLSFNRYRRKRPKVDASIFDSARSHTRRSDASEKKRRK